MNGIRLAPLERYLGRLAHADAKGRRLRSRAKADLLPAAVK